MSIGVRERKQGEIHCLLDLQCVVKFNFSLFVFLPMEEGQFLY